LVREKKGFALSQIMLYSFIVFLIILFFFDQIIQEGIERPEGSNELRKIQLRELALLNGTLREDGQIRYETHLYNLIIY